MSEHEMNVLKETNFSNLGDKKIGKVRDIYIQKDKLILITTDRHSSFDRIIAHVPFKGEILTQISNFWFEQTKDIVPNHIITTPDPRAVVVKRYEVIPVEVVIRGYLTGSTNTSIWTHYKEGTRDFGNFVLPDGMKKNQKFDEPVFTPSTKSSEHDVSMSPAEMVESGIVDKELLKRLEIIAMKLFARGQEIAGSRGLILVDTKYEFGLDKDGEIVLIDEIHTPDSSRYWYKETYEERFDKRLEPKYFDKEFLRLWFKENSDPYNDEVLPEAPEKMITELSRRYAEIYQQLIGKKFTSEDKRPALKRLQENLESYTI